jgi:putative nucleotidyltransferase with HDIG domain
MLMSPELADKLTKAIDTMPGFPRSVQRILVMTRDMNCSPKELIHVIEQDPLMTVKVLKVVNSAYYSMPTQVTSISHAVVYLGLNTIKNVALGIATIGVLPSIHIGGFDSQQYLLHSLATAVIAKKLAQRVNDADPMDCFVAGLLHDFGKIVFAKSMPQEFRKALEYAQWHGTSLHQALRTVVGVDHAVVGAMLIEKWHFAPRLVETIRNQGGDAVLDNGMVACVFAANQISKKLGLGFGGNPFVEPLPPTVVLRLGGSLDDVIASLGRVTDLLEDSKVFIRV